MALTTLRDICKNHCHGANAIGAFNIHNLEFIKGVIKGAEELNQPVIMMINEGVLMYGEIEVLGKACVEAAKRAKVDVAVMVDHGHNVEFLKKALDNEIDVMYDGSAEPFEDNVAVTKMLREYAFARGRSLEGEIGALGLSEDGDEENEAKMTTPHEAKVFADATGVDILAVSVGNVHGFYQGEAKIDVDRVKAISEIVGNLPVVMHGGSDIPYPTIKQSILNGIKKFNIATDLKFAYSKKMRELVGGEHMEIQPLKLFPVVADAVAEVVKEKIRMFNLEV